MTPKKFKVYKTFEMDSRVFSSVVKKLHVSSARRVPTNVLSGINITIDKEGLTMVASDGSRLGFYRDPSIVDLEKVSNFTIPSKSLDTFRKGIKARRDVTVKIEVGKKLASFSFEGSESVFEKMADSYPYVAINTGNGGIIPHPRFAHYQQKVNRKHLIKQLKEIKPFLSKKIQVVGLEFGKSTLKIKDYPNGEHSTETPFTAIGQLDALRIGFRYKNLLDALQCLKGDDVTISTEGRFRSTTFHEGGEPLHWKVNKPTFLVVVMPIQAK